MSTKHTPGPWSIVPNNDINEAIASANPVTAVAFIPLGHKDNEANAKLIAAAPDMLKALMSVQKYLYYKEENEGRGLGDFVHPKHAIQNAIDKATK